MSSREISNAKQGKEVFKKEQVLPDWFTGELYSEGAEVRNPYSGECYTCLLYTSPSPRDGLLSRMPSSA